VKLKAARDRGKSGTGKRGSHQDAITFPARLAMTDPLRAPDPFAMLDSLTRKDGLIWRPGDHIPTRSNMQALARQARARGIPVFISMSDGVTPGLSNLNLHVPERFIFSPHTDGKFCKREKPGLCITAAAHSHIAITAAARAGADAVLISPVFETASHPGRRPLGMIRFAALAHHARSLGLAVYALGGITSPEKIRRLNGTGITGIAGIGLFSTTNQA
jgi:thiamine-phosphate pyrophosphorylase